MHDCHRYTSIYTRYVHEVNVRGLTVEQKYQKFRQSPRPETGMVVRLQGRTSPSLSPRSSRGLRSSASPSTIPTAALLGSYASAECGDPEQCGSCERWKNIEVAFWRQRGFGFFPWSGDMCLFLCVAICFLFVAASFDISVSRAVATVFCRIPPLGASAFSLFHPLRLALAGHEYGATAAKSKQQSCTIGQQKVSLIIPGHVAFAG